MKPMKTETGNLHLAIAAVGSQNKLAKAIGVHQQRISDLMIKKNGHVPAELLVAISEASGIPRQVLRPDIFAGMDEG